MQHLSLFYVNFKWFLLNFEAMKKVLLTILIFFATAHCAMALPISQQKARAIAVAAYLSHGGSAADTSFVEVGKEALLANQYVFVAPEGKGFVIVAADDCVRSLLAISTNSEFSLPLPPPVETWLQAYDQQIEQAKKLSKTDKARKAGYDDSDASPEDYWFVGPLVETLWGQGQYYNSKCPAVWGERCAVGCVATAMAQVMRYWGYPERGNGSNGYYSSIRVGYVYARFDGRYEWDQMPIALKSNSARSQVNAVAQLSYHCGVAVNMEYGVDVSLAYLMEARNALLRNFNYSSDIRYLMKRDYSDDEWHQILKNEIDARRPVLYGGSGSGGGHAFVCDGYDSDGDFHFNWGWNGMYNGFFAIGNLCPGGGGIGTNDDNSFNLTNEIVIGIKPATITCDDIIVDSDTTVCDSLTWHGTLYTNSRVVEHRTPMANGCDSVDRLFLTVRHAYLVNSSAVACDSFVWNNVEYHTSGYYQYRVGAERPACDTIYEVKLIINHSTSGESYDTACQSLLWNGTVYTESGIYDSPIPLTSHAGCDSAATLHLTIFQPSEGHADTAACDMLMWNGLQISSDTTVVYHLVNQSGCDSLVNLDVAIHASSQSNEYAESSGPYIWHGYTFTTSGIYSVAFTTSDGCDSIVLLHLVVNPVGIEMADADAPHVYVSQNTINVSNAQHRSVSIFDMRGRRLFHIDSATNHCRFAATAAGSYIVVIGGEVPSVRKVVVIP